MKQLEAKVNEVAIEHNHLKVPVWRVPEWLSWLSIQLLISAYVLILGL